ncbi:MAG: ThiF family adenylyltransferase [Opitutaceae bacterium]
MSILDTVCSRSDKAVEEVSNVLNCNPNFERLSDEEVLAKEKRYRAGWITVAEPKDIGSRLELYLPAFFPDHPPEIYISKNPGNWFGKTPHVEQNGKICVLAESAAINADAPVNLVKECLERAVDILTEASEDEFRDEALIYWSQAEGKKHDAYCCTPASNLKDACVVGVANKTLVIAENEQFADIWFKNWRGDRAKFDFVAPCIVIELDEVLIPSDYPGSYADVRNLVEKHSPQNLNQFDDYACRGSGLFGAVLLQKTDEGAILAGIVAYGKELDHKKDYIKGFRPGQAPTELLRARAGKYFEMQDVRKVRITRTDAQWIHSRGGTGLNLSGKTVTLVGCGSLGGYVGHLLARAGVGNICLLDNDTLGWENVGRHLLGATEVGRSKSLSLAEKLRRELPHLNISNFRGDWREWIQEPRGQKNFQSSDLIISTVADWRCERPLNMVIRESGTLNSIFAWLEPYGLAAQVLSCGPKGGCFECGMDGLGIFKDRVLDFENGTLRKEPGGCAYYQQYGPTKILPLASLIVDTAIRRLTEEDEDSKLLTILEDLSSPPQYGGKVREDYVEYMNSDHSRTIGKNWARHTGCNCCQEETHG